MGTREKFNQRRIQLIEAAINYILERKIDAVVNLNQWRIGQQLNFNIMPMIFDFKQMDFLVQHDLVGVLWFCKRGDVEGLLSPGQCLDLRKTIDKLEAYLDELWPIGLARRFSEHLTTSTNFQMPGYFFLETKKKRQNENPINKRQKIA